jgi:hypothetical protein
MEHKSHPGWVALLGLCIGSSLYPSASLVRPLRPSFESNKGVVVEITVFNPSETSYIRKLL